MTGYCWLFSDQIINSSWRTCGDAHMTALIRLLVFCQRAGFSRSLDWAVGRERSNLYSKSTDDLRDRSACLEGRPGCNAKTRWMIDEPEGHMLHISSFIRPMVVSGSKVNT